MQHEFPRLAVYRGPRTRAGPLFRPVSRCAAPCAASLQQLQKLFRLRNCRDSFFAQPHASLPAAPDRPLLGALRGPDRQRGLRARRRRGRDGARRPRQRSDAARSRTADAAGRGERSTSSAPRCCATSWSRCASCRPSSPSMPDGDRDVDAFAIVGEPGDYAVSAAAGAGRPQPGHHELLSARARQRRRSAGLVPAAALRARGSAGRECCVNLELPDRDAVMRGADAQHAPASSVSATRHAAWRRAGWRRRPTMPRRRCACAARAGPMRPRCSRRCGEALDLPAVPGAGRVLRHQPYRRRGHRGLVRGVHHRRLAHARNTAASTSRRWSAATTTARCRGRGPALHAHPRRRVSPCPDLLLIDGGRGAGGRRAAGAAGAGLRRACWWSVFRRARTAAPGQERLHLPATTHGAAGAAAGFAGAAGDPARPRRGASLRDPGASPQARAPPPGVGARNRAGPRAGQAPRPAAALRRAAGRAARRRRRTWSQVRESAPRWRGSFMITCIRAPERSRNDIMAWNLPNILTWLRILAIPLVVVLFYLPYHWADRAAGLLFAAAVDHRFAGRLLRAPHGPDQPARRLPRSGGRQAHRGRGAGAAGQQGPAAG